MKKLVTLTAVLLASFLAPQVAQAADTQAPTVELKPWTTTVYGDTLPADVTVTDDVGVTKVEYAIDDVVVRTETAPNFDVYIDIGHLAAEAHNLKAKAYDAAGNVAITRPRNFTIDRTGPDVSIAGPELTNADYPQFSFSTTASDYRNGGCVIQDRGPDRDYFECSRDVPFAAGEILPEGEWQFVAHVSDEVGNKTVARRPFVIDRTAPELAITAGPADGATVDRGPVRYSWTATDPHGATQSCSVDGAAPAPCADGIDLDPSDGDHTLEVVATDGAGNAAKLTRRLLVRGPVVPDDRDTTGPVIELAAGGQRLKAIRKGLKVRVTCSEACAGELVARPAKRGKKTRGIRFAGRVDLAAAGTAAVRLVPKAKTVRKLKRLKAKRLKLAVSARLADPAGNTSTFNLKTKTRP